MNSSKLLLEPRAVWDYFYTLTQIPSPSGKEAAVMNFLGDVGQNLGEVCRSGDSFMTIRVPSYNPGKFHREIRENVPTVTLQAHVDMVCEREPTSEIDPTKDPLDVYIDGDYVKARGTTLGADNRIGVGLALTALGGQFPHGPLELLLTAGEETGMEGANLVGPENIHGSMLINLDSEKANMFVVGCAGGQRIDLSMPINRISYLSSSFMSLSISGLKGGHSGIQIHERGENSIKLMAKLLSFLTIGETTSLKYELAGFKAGDKYNVIPTAAEAIIAIEPGQKGRLEQMIGLFRERALREPGIQIELKPYDGPVLQQIYSGNKEKLIHLLNRIPHGVIRNNLAPLVGVRTSNNLAVVQTNEYDISIRCLPRSSVNEELERTVNILHSIASDSDATLVRGPRYPAWQRNPNSPLLNAATAAYREIMGEDPIVGEMHAGLETALFLEKMPGLDIISMGPTIHDPHTPNERVDIASVARSYEILKRTLTRIAQ